MRINTDQLFSEMLTKDVILIEDALLEKTVVLDKLVNLLANHPDVIDLESIRSAVFEREELMSTGVGEGLALPHARTDAVSNTVAAFMLLKSPVDYDAIDDQPVSMIILLVGPQNAKSQHIRILSRISRLMSNRNLRGQLLEANDIETVLAIFRAGEKSFS